MPVNHPASWLAAVLLLTGCAATSDWNPDLSGLPGSDSSSTPAAGGPSLTAFLDEATQGDQARFDETPWGQDALLRVGERYYAASGRVCRRLQRRNDRGAFTEAALACRTDSGWVAAEPLVTVHKEMP